VIKINGNFETLFLRAGSVFSPAAPVDRKALFAGRLDQLSRVIDAINTKGQHAIIYGERGVGKTSLANILHETLEVMGFGNVTVNKTNCDSTDDFSSVWRKALKSIVQIAEVPGIGFEPTIKQYMMDLAQTLGEGIVPNEICRAFLRCSQPIVFIFDEFDRMHDARAAELFADTMKSLSDQGITGTLVLVGVGDDVDDLIEGHESIARSLIQIRVPRMSVDELKQIVQRALESLGMTINESALDRVVRLSQGLPHYTHLLGLGSARAALRVELLNIALEHVNLAIGEAVQQAQQSVVSAYQKATSSPHSGHLYKEVLLACALAQGDELGYFAAGDIRNPLSRIMQKKYEISAFAQHLNKFTSEARGNILVKAGLKRSFRYRFKNPLMRPYVVIRGFHDRLLNESNLDLIPIWSP